jgi:hypothetical protein
LAVGLLAASILSTAAAAEPVQPTVALGPDMPISATAISVAGFVDAEGSSTTYYFEYGEADCASGTCASVPVGRDASTGEQVGAVRVSQTISGLRALTTYHYRLVATNSAGTEHTQDATFTTLKQGLFPACANEALRITQHSVGLPDCRAYEVVSSFRPEERNGADVLVNTQRIRAATDGSAFEFPSLAGAGDVAGVPLLSEYMAVRDPRTGWSVHGITPPEPASSLPKIVNYRESQYLGNFTDDLSRGIFRSTLPLSAEGPNVRETTNLYRREDLLTPGAGVYRLLSDAATPQSPYSATHPTGEDQEIPLLAGVSADLSHVVFESPRDLTADAVGLGVGPRLYESVNGAVRLVGVLPASEGGGPVISKAGRGAKTYSPHLISADGSRVLFTGPPFGTAEAPGWLYLRDDRGTANVSDDTTVEVNASEKTNGAGPGGTDTGGVQPATFWDASTDMSRVFFTSTEALTDEAPSDEPTVAKLYRYELNAPSGHHLTLLSVDRNPGDGISDGAEGVVGVSDDGSYVYFVGANQLVAGGPIATTPRIFLWHEGRVAQVAAINSGTETGRIVGNLPLQVGGRWSRVAPDGKHLSFVSEGTPELTGYDQGSTCSSPSTRCKEVYVYSAATADGNGSLQCASCSPDGRVATKDADYNIRSDATIIQIFVTGDAYLNRDLSSDGRFVFFTSGEKLSPGDENENPDAYEFDTETGAVHLLSGGLPGTAAYFLDASRDGHDVFFATRGQLLERDRDQSVDVYDAHVEGGFDEPAAAPAPCASEAACRPPTSIPPTELNPISSVIPPVAHPAQAGHKHRQKKHRKPRQHRRRKASKRHG